MIAPYTEAQKVRIVNNVVKACKDIKQLNKQGYKFINLASGFIAHYDLRGFIAYYEDYSLAHEIKENASFNQWNNFHEGDENYEYYMSKKDIYNRIVAKI
jgi:hypothetical protein